jgi:hypothetical protein
MLPVLLLGLAVGYAPNDVSLADLNRFTITDAQLRDRSKVLIQFYEFLRETRPAGQTKADSNADWAYSALNSARHKDYLQNRLSALRWLRKQLGDEDYYAGKLPSTYPLRYQRAFERWQADKKAGRQRLPNGVLKDPT